MALVPLYRDLQSTRLWCAGVASERIAPDLLRIWTLQGGGIDLLNERNGLPRWSLAPVSADQQWSNPKPRAALIPLSEQRPNEL
jgi:hypothetical protein